MAARWRLTLQSTCRLGLAVLLVGFPLQFMLQQYGRFPRAVALWSDILVVSLLGLLVGFGRPHRLPALALPLGVILTVGIVSTLANGADAGPALAMLRLLLISPAVALLTALTRGSDAYWRRLMGLFLLTLAGQALIATLQSVVAGAGNVDAGQGTFGPNSANSVGDCLVIGLAMLVDRQFGRPRGTAAARWLLIALFLAGLVLTSSRLGLALLGAIVILLVVRRGRPSWRFIGGAACLLIVAMWLVNWYYGGTEEGTRLLSPERALLGATTVYSGANEPPRVVLAAWAYETIDDMRQLPVWATAIVGTGPGTFGSYASTSSGTPFAARIEAVFHAWGILATPGLYNEYLTVIAELGLVGLVAYVWLLWKGWSVAWRVYGRTTRPLWRAAAAGALAGALVLAGRAVVANAWEDRVIGFYAWFLVGMIRHARAVRVGSAEQ